WSFGDPDGATSTARHPVFTYPGPGTYEVCLTVSNLSGEDSACQLLTVGPVSTPHPVEEMPWLLYPNPVNEVLYLSAPYPVSGRLQLIDVNGRELLGRELRGASSPYPVDVGHIPAGLYWLRFIDRKGAGPGWVRKVVVY
ncbi:MAG: T9SS type A sorting domain-containing protein, partial [Lewinella sp.]|nr:T9SS type A sorting domain-containing protein [Lewinella sp.]